MTLYYWVTDGGKFTIFDKAAVRAVHQGIRTNKNQSILEFIKGDDAKPFNVYSIKVTYSRWE